jgi:hypothetical protein
MTMASKEEVLCGELLGGKKEGWDMRIQALEISDMLQCFGTQSQSPGM